MKLASIFLCLLISLKPVAQKNLGEQLKFLVQDTISGFKNFKGGFKKLQDNDSVFNSNLTFEETTNNDILFSASASLYLADIIDSVNVKKGRKIVDEWKDKIYYYLGAKFKLKKIEIREWNPAVYGWKFEHGNLWIDITMYPQGVLSLYFIGLSISFNSGSYSYKVK